MGEGGTLPKAQGWQSVAAEGEGVIFLWGYCCSQMPTAQWVTPHPGTMGQHCLDSELLITVKKEDMKLSGRYGMQYGKLEAVSGG